MPHLITRRSLLQLAASVGGFCLAGGKVALMQKQRSAAEALDHLIIGTSDLDRGIQWFEARTGVRAVIGGVHPGRGTRNALAALKGRQYVELLAPDPAQAENLSAHLRSISEPRVIGWAVSTNDIAALEKRLRQMQHEPTAPRPGARSRPDGKVLKWTALGVASKFAAEGVDPIPFFIQWAADSAHPSGDSPGGCELVSIEFEHPNADDLSDALGRLELAAQVRAAQAAAIVVTLNTTKGTTVLR